MLEELIRRVAVKESPLLPGLPPRMNQVSSPVIDWKELHGRNGKWQIPDYDLLDVDRFSDIEAYVMLSFIKREALFKKAGFTFIGDNPELVEYVQRRLEQIAMVSKTTVNLLINKMAQDFIRYQNVWVAKVRSSKASGGYPYRDITTGKRLEPIAGLFVLPAGTMEYEKDLNTEKVIRWRQHVPGTKKIYREYSLEDISHFYSNKKPGQVIGTPKLVPVIEDIKAFRRIEENVELLVVQGSFPIVQYKVGTPEMPARDVLSNGMSEIEYVSEQIERKPPEGIYVTPERHEIKMIGSEGRALRVEAYMEHFKKRVLAGLYMSSIDVGEGDTANRATAENMSNTMINEVRAIQQEFAEFFYLEIIEPLLFESGADLDFMDPANKVFLVFNEIDFDSKVKKENNDVQLWLQNGITHKEFRNRLGYGEMDEGEWDDTYFSRITRALTLTTAASGGAADPLAHAASRDPNTPIEKSDISKAQKVAKETAKAEAKLKTTAAKPASAGSVSNRNAPRNQHGTKSSSAKSTRDSSGRDGAHYYILDSSYADTELDELKRNTNFFGVSNSSGSGSRVGIGRVDVAFFETKARRRLSRVALEKYQEGAKSVGVSDSELLSFDFLREFEKVQKRVDKYVGKLFKDINDDLDENLGKDKVTTITSILDSIGYRLPLIERTEGMKAFNWGAISGLKMLNIDEYGIDIGKDTDPEEIEMTKRTFRVIDANFENIPPFHPNGTLKVVRK